MSSVVQLFVHSQPSERRIQKDKRRQAEALKELDTLGSLSSLIVYTPRQRRQAKHPNADYELALEKGCSSKWWATSGFR
jgi:hypothetical protein